MTWIVEIILICVFIVGAYYGYACGFFRLVGRPLRTLVTVLFAFSLCRQVGDFLFVPVIRSAVTNYVAKFITDKPIGEIPTVVKLAAIMSGQDELLSYGGSTADIINQLSLPFTSLLASMLAFVLLIIFVRMTFSTALHLADRLVSKGTIGKINRMLGFVLAGALSVVLVLVLVSAMDILFHSDLLSDTEFVRSYRPGPIYNAMRRISPIELLLSF